MLENCCIFAVEEEGGFYLVISTDRQAAKDNIFVEQGQEISIRGSAIKDINFKGVVITEQAKIKICKDTERTECIEA